MGVRATLSGCTDPEGDTLSYAYRWFLWDGRQRAWVLKQETNSRRASDVLSAALTSKGQRWKCSVRAGDGRTVSGWVETLFTVRNSPPPPPRLAVAPPTSGQPVVATVAAVRDADGDPLKYGFRWRLNGVTKRLVTGVASADSLPAQYTRKGQVWTCQAWIGDGEALSTVTEVQVTVRNGAPPAPHPGIVAPPPAPGEPVTVRVAPVKDPDGDQVVYGYRWLLNGVTKRTKVTSATSDTLPAGLTRAGQSWTVVVRAGDGKASSSPAEAQVQVGSLTTASVGGGLVVTSVSAVPTAAGAQIVFALSAPASVQAEVLNIAGRPVKLITPGTELTAGTQTMLWTGGTDAGLRAPNGRYLVRITARGSDGTESQALATVLVQR